MNEQSEDILKLIKNKSGDLPGGGEQKPPKISQARAERERKTAAASSAIQPQIDELLDLVVRYPSSCKSANSSSSTTTTSLTSPSSSVSLVGITAQLRRIASQLARNPNAVTRLPNLVKLNAFVREMGRDAPFYNVMQSAPADFLTWSDTVAPSVTSSVASATTAKQTEIEEENKPENSQKTPTKEAENTANINSDQSNRSGKTRKRKADLSASSLSPSSQSISSSKSRTNPDDCKSQHDSTAAPPSSTSKRKKERTAELCENDKATNEEKGENGKKSKRLRTHCSN